MSDGWPILLVLRGDVRGGEELGRLFPGVDPFLEFFLGEFCYKTNRVIMTLLQ